MRNFKHVLTIVLIVLMVFTFSTVSVFAAHLTAVDETYGYEYYYYQDNTTKADYKFYCIIEKSNGKATLYANVNQDYSGHCCYRDFNSAADALSYLETGSPTGSGFLTTSQAIAEGTLVAGNLDGYLKAPEYAGIVETPEHGGGGTSFDAEEERTWWQKLISGIENLGETVSNFFSSFWDAFVETFEIVCVPSDEYLSSMGSRFEGVAAITNIGLFGERIKTMFRENIETPPVININLGAAEGKYNYGSGSVTAIDFSWYARYKPTVDAFLSAFLWGGFCYLSWRHFGDILNGTTVLGSGFFSRSETYTHRVKENNKSDVESSGKK